MIHLYPLFLNIPLQINQDRCLLQIGHYDGAILLKWEKDALLRQIEYGASLGQINLENAKNELDTFFENEAELISYFQHHKMLHVVSRWKVVLAIYVVIKYNRNAVTF